MDSMFSRISKSSFKQKGLTCLGLCFLVCFVIVVEVVLAYGLSGFGVWVSSGLVAFHSTPPHPAIQPHPIPNPNRSLTPIKLKSLKGQGPRAKGPMAKGPRPMATSKGQGPRLTTKGQEPRAHGSRAKGPGQGPGPRAKGQTSVKAKG